MSKINVSRVFLGGLVAGLVGLAGDVIIVVAIPLAVRAGFPGGPHLPPPSAQVMVMYIAAVLLVGGPAGIWFYAAIRPRFGPGPKTATYGGLWIWLILVPYMQIVLTTLGLNPFSAGLLLLFDAISLPLIIAAMVAGAFVYKEEDAVRAAGAGQ